MLAVVADGAGSAQFGAYGAWLTCRFLKVRFREFLRDQAAFPSDSQLYEWIDDLRDQIAAAAGRRNTTSRQFAATLAAVLVSPTDVLTMQIGDSSVVARKAGEWDVLCWPENGEYASTTYFVTDDPEPRLHIARMPREHDAFALFTDGVGDLALLHSEQRAHLGFIEPMMRPVDDASARGRLGDLSAKLATYLAGPKVCARTDDDKTLLLISGG